MEPVLLLVLGVALAGVIGWYGWYRAKQRRELLRAFAASNRWTWTARDDRWTNAFEGSPFGTGADRKALNVLQGTWRDRPMVAFDYSYETHSTDSQGRRTTQVHRYSVCALTLPVALPRVELAPEGFLGRFGTMLGMQDIELESEDFNRRYRVRADEPRRAYDVLPARTMEALLARPAVHLRLAGADAVCWEDGSHSPAELLQRLDTLDVLLDGIPSYLWNDLKGPAS